MLLLSLGSSRSIKAILSQAFEEVGVQAEYESA